MDEFAGNGCELGKVSPDEGALGVKALGLRDRIEDPEPGLGLPGDAYGAVKNHSWSRVKKVW
jgi:hypothetical protein